MSDTTDVLPDGARTASPDAPVPVEATAPTPNGSANGAHRAADGTEGAVRRRRPAGTGLASMLLPELQEMAGTLGISGVGRLRKGQLIAAIQTAQGPTGAAPAAPAQAPATQNGASGAAPSVAAHSNGSPLEGGQPSSGGSPSGGSRQRSRRGASRPAGGVTGEQGTLDAVPTAVATAEADAPGLPEQRGAGAPPADEVRAANGEGARPPREDRPARQQGDRQQGERPARGQQGQGGNRNQGDRNQGENRNQGGNRNQNDRNQGDTGPDRNEDGDGNRRRGRFRERNRGRNRGGGQGGQGGYSDPDPVIREDDVLLPVAGILDILDNYAFVRTSGYLTGSNDVYVSLAQVRRGGLRRGDAVTGAVRQPQEGERKDKYNALVRLDTVNGQTPEEARQRPEFTKLTPLYPQDRLRLETEPSVLTTRVIDLVMPIGKGQRALIVSPPKAGKTMVLQAIANAITTNNPECHLMVVLVDERPEEVTDMQRSVKGEVIASTFDRPPSDHTSIAELSIERAKRLVELGHDVVVLLDSITRLGRAYNLAAPASGRILSGGVDSTALYPPKRFLGAARNIENGGSLTIIATALVETGSTMDTVIFEEFKGTGNAELKLDRKIADKRVFPAIDVDQSGTRKEEILLPGEELAIIHKLRRVLHALDSQQALSLVLERLKDTKTNYEFLMQIARTTPGQD